MTERDIRVSDTVVQLRDGTKLATEVVLVEGGGPRPALVIRGPYSRKAIRTQDDIVDLARQGWAVVAQDVRGRFDSEGEFDPWYQEGPDGSEVIAWAAAQPWCDGAVVTTGASYLGMAQLQAALRRPPALKAIAPIVPGGDVRDGWIYEGGAFRLSFAGPYAATLSNNPKSPEDMQAVFREIYSDLSDVLRTPHGKSPMRGVVRWYDRWLDARDDYWAPLDVIAQVHRITVPSFLVAGWYDLFCEDTLALHTALAAGAGTERARRGQRLVIGPWAHVGVYQHVTADCEFGLEANGLLEGIPEQLNDWMLRAARDEEVEGGVRAYLTGAEAGPGGRWRDWPVWPPSTQPLPLYLTSDGHANSRQGDGRLSFAAPGDARQDRWRHDPDDPVPSVGGRPLGPWRPFAGPVDQREVEARDDVLVYSSAPLEQAIEIAGEVVADVVVASSAPSTDVCVKLVDVFPTGRAENVVDSVTRTAVEPDQPTSVRVRVGSALHRFAPGHRIRVQVAASNFPRLDMNPHSGVRAADATAWLPATNTLYHGGPTPSRITLPVLS